MEKIKFIVIHNRDPERKKVISQVLLSNGVNKDNIEFIEYPNKNELSYKIKNKSVQKKSRRHNFNFPGLDGSLKDGWICVSYKHYQALEKIVENKYPLAVIVEDNVGNVKKNILTTLSACLEQLPKDWDVVFDSSRAHSMEMLKEQVVKSDKLVYKKNLGYSYNEDGKVTAGGGSKSAQFFSVKIVKSPSVR